jgi:thiamine kinase-like enzyme
LDSTGTRGRIMSELDDRINSIPIWRGPVTWAPLKGGLSNESYTAEDDSGKYVVRFGRDYPFHHVSRDREIMVARAAHAAGFAPELVYAEPGTMVSRFIEARTYCAEDMRDQMPRIADTVRRFHSSMPNFVSGPAFMFWVFHVIRDYAETLRSGNSRMTAHLDEYVALANAMEAMQVPLPIIFGHHDCLPANFMDDGEKLWIIDFEYAGFSTPMFDLAGIAANGQFDTDLASSLLAAYFGKPPAADLLKSHSAMRCASLLRESMWSMVSELYLDAPGVDYVAYTDENLVYLEEALDQFRSTFGGF